MKEERRFGRWQSAGLGAAGFFVLLYILSSAMFLTPFGVLFHAAMFAGVPVVVVTWLQGVPPSGLQLWLAMLMPYPAIGFALGLWRPLERPLFWRATVQMAVRLGITMALLIMPGLVLFLSSKAH